MNPHKTHWAPIFMFSRSIHLPHSVPHPSWTKISSGFAKVHARSGSSVSWAQTALRSLHFWHVRPREEMGRVWSLEFRSLICFPSPWEIFESSAPHCKFVDSLKWHFCLQTLGILSVFKRLPQSRCCLIITMNFHKLFNISAKKRDERNPPENNSKKAQKMAGESRFN